MAFRTEILRECIHEFMNETFMGFHKEVSDDRSLTNLTLKKGYKTVMQDTSVVYTDAPTSWKKFIRQQLRWAEGS
ncbi:glycosyltransferase, partial [Streptococcus pneumoniae]|nr:glycosyltransferase [Streptococcus pneumoniae]